ncbi:MAG: hypothetical protein JXB88_13470 [Spirochaetales bacterium]|nr:hypothetical protein [Spirochaetales bacterium]
MAKERSLLKELIRKAHLMDDTDWESLTSKGIVRRARKDMERENINDIKEDDEGVTILFKTYEIRIPRTGFSGTQCSCPATSMCHHIVMCGLHLAGLGEKEENNAVIIEETIHTGNKPQNWMLDLSIKKLIAWSGIQNYRKAYEFLKKNDNFKIDEKEKIRISFPSEEMEITSFFDSDPDGMIIPGSLKTRKMIGTAAVLAYRLFKGKRDDVSGNRKTNKESGKRTHARDRDFIKSVNAFIEEIMRTGLNRLTEVFLVKCHILSTSARAVHMIRMSRFIDVIKDLIIKSIENHAGFRTDTLLFILSQVSILAGRIVHDIDNEELRGVSRTEYTVYDYIQLSGLGCHTWKTASGFLGITAYFWEEKEKRILTWSDVRLKESALNFKPEEIYQHTSIWNSGISLYDLVRSSFLLKNPRINKLGRISLSQDTACHDIISNSSIEWNISPFPVKEWKLFYKIAYQNMPLGLKEYNPQKDIIIIHPHEWGKREYNPVDQQFYWWLKDQKNEYLCLKIAYTGDNSAVLDHLKSVKRHELKNYSVLGKIIRDKSGFSFYPVSFINISKGNYRQINAGLDYSIPYKKKKVKKITEQQATGNIPETFDVENAFYETGELAGSATLSLLRQIESELVKLAEKGTMYCWSNPSSRLKVFGQQCIDIGLPFLGKCIRKLLREQKGGSRNLLFCRYLIHLHIQASYTGIIPGYPGIREDHLI